MRASTMAGVRGGGAEKRGAMILDACAYSWQAVRILCADQLIDRPFASSAQMFVGSGFGVVSGRSVSAFQVPFNKMG